MFSTRNCQVRESPLPITDGNHPDRRARQHDSDAATLTENSTLFLAHQLRQQESTRPSQSSGFSFSWMRWFRRSD